MTALITRLIRSTLAGREWLDRCIWEAAVLSPVLAGRVKAGIVDLNARRLVDWEDK